MSNKTGIHIIVMPDVSIIFVVDSKLVSKVWHILSGDGNLNVKKGELKIQLLNLAAMRI